MTIGNLQEKRIGPRTASALLIAGALTFGLAACGGDEAEPAPAPESAAESEFAPEIEVTGKAAVFEIEDSESRTIELTATVPEVRVTGVDQEIADSFSQAVADDFSARLQEQLDRYRDLDLLRCVGEPYGDVAPGGTCAVDAGELVIEHAGVYGDYGSVVTRSGFMLNDAGGERNPQVHGVTMNLKTGEGAALDEFLDLADPEARQRAASAVVLAKDWDMCSMLPTPEDPAGYLDKAVGFAPTTNGVELYWAPNGYPSECQAAEALVPWPEGHESPNEVTDAEASGDSKTAEGVNGEWCPAPGTEGDGAQCVSIRLPNVSYADGATYELSENGEQGGGFSFSLPGAPFGTYYPAGVEIGIPDYYGIEDLPDQDRIWDGQGGTLLVRR